VGVVGAGAMGTGIAALAASAGFPVVLLDIPDAPDRDGRAKGAVDRALKSRMPVFMDPACASRIAVGNTEDHLHRLKDCQWIIEGHHRATRSQARALRAARRSRFTRHDRHVEHVGDSHTLARRRAK
jgi:3-hydroxyacyl-CoA dehydrogenase